MLPDSGLILYFCGDWFTLDNVMWLSAFFLGLPWKTVHLGPLPTFNQFPVLQFSALSYGTEASVVGGVSQAASIFLGPVYSETLV